MSIELLPKFRSPEAQHPSGRMSLALALGGAAAAITLDQIIPRRNHRNAESKASFLSYNRDQGDRAIFVLPGSRTDGRLMAHEIDGHLGALGDTSYAVYSEKGFCMDSLKDSLLEERQKNIDRPASIYAVSMGGLVLSNLLGDESFRREFGEIETILFDSSPSGIEDVHPQTRRALDAAGLVGDSWVVSNAAKLGVRMWERKRLAVAFADSPAESSGKVSAQRINSNTRLSTTVAQGKFISQNNIKDESFVDVAKRQYYIYAPDDPVINTQQAAELYDKAYGGVSAVHDTDRPSNSHAAGVFYPGAVVDIFSGRLESDDAMAEVGRRLI